MTTEQSDSVDHPNLGRRMAKGATWMVMLRLAVRSIGLINTFILARLLLPEDFGLIALAMVTITLLDTLSEFGFETALIRDQKTTRAHYDTAWTVAVIKGILVATLLFVAAEPIAGFFDEPRLVWVIRALCVIPLLEGFKNIGVVNFTKNLNFRKEFQPKGSAQGLRGVRGDSAGHHLARLLGAGGRHDQRPFCPAGVELCDERLPT